MSTNLHNMVKMLFYLYMKKSIIILVTLIVAVLAGIWFLASYDNGLVITRSAISVDKNGEKVISGTVENKTKDKTYLKVGVNIKYLDASGEIVGQESLETKSLGPHMVWGFKENIDSNDVTTFKIKTSSAHFLGLRW